MISQYGMFRNCIGQFQVAVKRNEFYLFFVVLAPRHQQLSFKYHKQSKSH